MKGDYTDQLFDEAIALLERTRKTRNETSDTLLHLTIDEKRLLEKQVDIMADYAVVLVTRIKEGVNPDGETH